MRDLLDALPAAIYMTDAAGRITFYNRAAAELAGHEPVLGKDEWCVTWRLFRPDGSPMPHDECPMAIALKEGCAPRGVEAVAERPDGSRFPFIPFPTPLHDCQGRLTGAVNMLVDISAQKASEAALRASEERYRRLSESLEARVVERTQELADANQRLRAEISERERTEAQLLQALKMEAVGQMASGLAHDFNNLLTAILGNLELAEARLVDPDVRKRIAAARRAALRGARLNEQMLAFSRKQHLAPRPLNIGALVGDTCEMLRRTLGGIVEVEAWLPEDLWPAVADPTQLELMILNLAINARDAMPLGGTVRVEARNVKAGESEKPSGLAHGDYVCIAVSDTGTGMSEAVRARACEPFFTTKGPGKGSGLGLSQVYGVVRQSGGDLAIASVLGRGTTVELYLPCTESSSLPAVPVDLAPPGAAPRLKTVLVVDDQADVREVAATHLASLGYQVVEAASGADALAALDDGAVDLLIADYAMAKMTGCELAESARVLRPELPILITSGHLDGAETAACGVEWLEKPYRLDQLAAAVDRALSGAESAKRTALSAAQQPRRPDAGQDASDPDSAERRCRSLTLI